MPPQRAWGPVDILQAAKQELAQSRAEPDPLVSFLQRRQAAEKAWLAVAEATDRAFGLPGRGPAANQARRKALRALDAAAGTQLLDEFDRYQRVLHGACFYERECPEPDVEQLIARADTYPQRLKAAQERAP